MTLPARFGFYAFRTVWPEDLNFIYPMATGLSYQVFFFAGVALLAGGGWLSLRWLRRWPWFALAWGWAVACFLPVSGISTVGASFTSDRYTYLLLCGVFLGLAYRFCALVVTLRARSDFTGMAGHWLAWTVCVACLGLLSGLSYVQTRIWRDSESLFLHSVAVRPFEVTGYVNMGTLLVLQGRSEEAMAYYEKAVEMQPRNYISHFNLGNLYRNLGREEDAVESYRAALKIYPDYPPALLNLARFLRQGYAGRAPDLEEAEELVERACGPQARLNRALYLNTLVEIRLERGNVEGAREALREALATPTNNARLAADLERKRADLRRAGLWP